MDGHGAMTYTTNAVSYPPGSLDETVNNSDADFPEFSHVYAGASCEPKST